MTDKPSSLTLADLEEVEKAQQAAIEAHAHLRNDRLELIHKFHWLCDDHAVEMKQALTEALEVLESVRRYRDRMWRTEQHTGWLEWQMLLNKFHENWPGLVKKDG